MAYIFISPIFTLVLLRRAHWLNMTCGYHYKRVYRPGRINVADPISRAPQHHVHRAATLAAVRLATTLRSHRPCTLATCPQNVEYRAAVPEPGHSMLTPLSLSLSTTVGSDSLLLHCWDAGGAGRPVDEIARSAISVGGSDAPICDLADDAMEHWLQPLVPLCVARTRRSSSPCAEPVGEAQDPVSYCRKTFFDRLKGCSANPSPLDHAHSLADVCKLVRNLHQIYCWKDLFNGFHYHTSLPALMTYTKRYAEMGL